MWKSPGRDKELSHHSKSERIERCREFFQHCPTRVISQLLQNPIGFLASNQAQTTSASCADEGRCIRLRAQIWHNGLAAKSERLSVSQSTGWKQSARARVDLVLQRFWESIGDRLAPEKEILLLSRHDSCRFW